MDFITQHAVKFGKHDMERLGLFVEMPYMNGKGYVSPFPKPKVTKGRNILPSAPKWKCGNQDGYFDDEFRRLFEGECIVRPPKRQKDGKKKGGKAISDKPFTPAGNPKWQSTPGDHYGTFGGIVEAFGTGRDMRKKKKKPEKPLRNLMTNPGKKGGPGYVDICMSKYPEHLPDPYRPKPKRKSKKNQQPTRAMITVHFPQPYFDRNPFFEKEDELGAVYKPPKIKPIKGGGPKWCPTGPTKWQGGCHAGMFSPYPEHLTDRDRKMDAKLKKEKMLLKRKLEAKGKFEPQSMATKKMLAFSIMLHNTDLCVNAKNYKVFEPVYTKYLLARLE